MYQYEHSTIWSLEPEGYQSDPQLGEPLSIEGAASGGGTYPPTVGLDVTADGAAWLLTAEYRESNAEPWKASENDDRHWSGTRSHSAPRSALKIRCPRAILRISNGMPPTWTAPCSIFRTGPMRCVRDDLFQMPDGIFETALGTYYMGVRVINRWGLPFTDDNVLDITAASRADLAMRGVRITDAWTQADFGCPGPIPKRRRHGTFACWRWAPGARCILKWMCLTLHRASTRSSLSVETWPVWQILAIRRGACASKYL
ncbi:MAG: hypothetical protein IPM81_05100 [Saprospirales bacterium]|nr:hypothetical protein [Saprospirales bacterium]